MRGHFIALLLSVVVYTGLMVYGVRPGALPATPRLDRATYVAMIVFLLVMLSLLVRLLHDMPV